MAQTAHDELLTATADRIAYLIDQFARFGVGPDGSITRPSFSAADLECRAYFKKLLTELGLETHTDYAGNIFGRRAGTDAGRPSLLLGSHLDSVPNGGRYDGPLGMAAALEVVRELNRRNVTTRHPVEVVMFTAEEPNRFGLSTLGSRACAGRLPLERARVAHNGEQSLADALRSVGGDLDRLNECRFAPERVAAYLELHIEQGIRLEETGLPVGIVTAITGIQRLWLTVIGEANHAGTTTMRRRHDALTLAADLVLYAEKLAKAHDSDEVVATVGYVDVTPNAPNVVPGRVRMLVEIRSPDQAAMDQIATDVMRRSRELALERGLRVEVERELNQPPEMMDDAVRTALSAACEQLGLGYMDLASMAGHDAAHMAAVTRSGMVFVPSQDGKSHCPEEYTDPAAAAAGVLVMTEALLRLDAELD